MRWRWAPSGWWLGMGVYWQAALVPAVAALIVTCPCGFAIAVPAVQAVAVGALFRRGVLVANGTALERLASADVAVLDKTGTLTEGRPTLLPGGDWTAGDLRDAAAVARASRHPLAKALAAACPDAPLAPGVAEVPGRGLVRGGVAVLGSAAFLGVRGDGGGAGMTLWFRRGAGARPVAFRFADRCAGTRRAPSPGWRRSACGRSCSRATPRRRWRRRRRRPASPTGAPAPTPRPRPPGSRPCSPRATAR
jgi:Cu2+-exporting ATPase